MDLFIERRAFVQVNGDVDEFITLVLKNNSSVPFDLHRVWLQIPVTDAKCDVLAVGDGYPGHPEWWASEVDERFLIAMCAREAIPPTGTRIVGVHVLCRERCTVEQDRIIFRDPCLLGDLRLLAPERVATIATVIFPPDDLKRHIHAPGAREVTSRTATWEFRPAEGQPQQLYACLEVAPCAVAVCLWDDGLAALHELISRDACSEAFDVGAALAPLSRALVEQNITAPTSFDVLNDLQGLLPLTRQQCLRRVLHDGSRGSFRQSLSDDRPLPAIVIPAGGRSLTPLKDDYTLVEWGSDTFLFTKDQGKVVAALDAAQRAGRPVMHQRVLLAKTAWTGTRLSDYFKQHPAWKSLIVPGVKRGYYLLGSA